MSTFFEGEKIKIFPDTDVGTYTRWIRKEGFTYQVNLNDIEILKKVSKTVSPKLFGRLIREKMYIYKLNSDELADIIQVNKDTLLNWELGFTIPNSYNMGRIKEALKITETEMEECRI